MVEYIGNIEISEQHYRDDKCAGCGKDIKTNMPNPVYCMDCEDKIVIKK